MNLWLDRIASWMNRRAALCFVLFSCAYWLIFLCRAPHEPFIFDEITTWHVARLPSMSSVWQALMRGIDQELPLTHLIVRSAISVLGPTHLAARLPSTLGFWLMMLCLFIVLLRRIPVPFALAGAILPMLTDPWNYAIEARAYGMMLGAAGLALLSWDTVAVESRRRGLALAGIALGLGIGLSVHMMFVMVGLPLALGELVRSWERRRIDWPVWIAFALPMPALIIYPMVMKAASGYDLTNLYPRPDAIPAFFSLLLKPAVFPLLVSGIAIYLTGREPAGPEKTRVSRSLAAVLIACASLPAIFITIGFVTRHFFFVPRYGVLSVIGVVSLTALGASWACRNRARAGVVTVAVLLGWIGFTRVLPALRDRGDPRANALEANPLLRQAIQGELPVVVSDPAAFMVCDFYYTEADARRLHFVTDLAHSRRSAGENINQVLLTKMKGTIPIRGEVEPYAGFVTRNSRFLVYMNADHPQVWLSELLLRDRAHLRLAAQSGGESLVLVENASPTEASRLGN